MKNIIFAMAVYESELQQPSSLVQTLQPVSLVQLKNSTATVMHAKEIPKMLADGELTNDQSDNSSDGETIRIGDENAKDNSLAKSDSSEEEFII